MDTQAMRPRPTEDLTRQAIFGAVRRYLSDQRPSESPLYGPGPGNLAFGPSPAEALTNEILGIVKPLTDQLDHMAELQIDQARLKPGPLLIVNADAPLRRLLFLMAREWCDVVGDTHENSTPSNILEQVKAALGMDPAKPFDRKAELRIEEEDIYTQASDMTRLKNYRSGGKFGPEG